SAESEQPAAKAAARIAPMPYQPIELRQIHVEGLIGRRIQMTIENNLLRLNLDRDFLRPFKEKSSDGGYIGLGKTLDAVAHLAAYTQDKRLLELRTRLLTETLACQEPDGYLGMMKPESRMWSLWDVHEMSYLVYGLVSDYRLFQEKRSLEAAQKIADYIVRRWSAEPDRIPGGGQIALHMAVTGIEPAMLALYETTGQKKYLDFCTQFRRLPDWEGRIVLGRWGKIEGHAYAYMARCMAQLRLDRIEPNPRLWQCSRDVVDFLTARNGLVITGTCGDHECWHDTQEGTINLGETCATAYLIRFLHELLQREANPLYGDIMERAIYNALFAAQSPDGRRIRYYTPFDGPRRYFDLDTYCCPCNYRRIVAELPQMIYYRSAQGVMVNLYAPSMVKLELADGLTVSLRQQTQYPHGEQVVLHVTPSRPAEFELALRIPRWCREARVRLPGGSLAQPANPGTFFVIKRQWQADDRVVLELPMDWRWIKGRVAQAGRAALMRGPLVFCLNRQRNKLPADMDLRLLVVDTSSLAGPLPDDSVQPAGWACRVRAWGPGQWYPLAQTDLELVLTEFPDPEGEAIYFKVPNPNAPELEDDELYLKP
ncbi:MAG: glycoside hydrolase family 127 protein, partial [Thermoguttaceae bacterium]|nr:glycoside hydrolase family 127 protein [Thermoguttaceae bacterium]